MLQRKLKAWRKKSNFDMLPYFASFHNTRNYTGIQFSTIETFNEILKRHCWKFKSQLSRMK